MLLLKSCLSLLAFATLCIAQVPPRLIYSLRSSYTFNTATQQRVRPCQFTGVPAPTVSWTFEGTEVSTSSEFDGLYYSPSNGTLVIERADASSNGMYECRGTNTQGTVSFSTEFIFIRTGGTPWYISWYMWFVYAIVIWALTIPVFVAWFFCQKKRAAVNLPPANEWIGN